MASLPAKAANKSTPLVIKHLAKLLAPCPQSYAQKLWVKMTLIWINCLGWILDAFDQKSARSVEVGLDFGNAFRTRLHGQERWAPLRWPNSSAGVDKGACACGSSRIKDQRVRLAPESGALSPIERPNTQTGGWLIPNLVPASVQPPGRPHCGE